MGGDEPDELIRRAATGDESAFEAMLRLHAPKLEAYVRRHLPQDVARHADVNDVLQETYFNACRRMTQFDAADADSAARWLMTIARHRLVDLVRHHRASKRRGRAMAADADDVENVLQELAVYERTPSQSALSHERRLVLAGAIERLRPIYQQVIRLRYFEGVAIREAAEQLGRSEHAVHMLCNRAVRELSRQLQAVGENTAG